MKKEALCIGLDYKGSGYELPDCHMDAAEIEARAKKAGYYTEKYTGILGAKKMILAATMFKDLASPAGNDITLIQFSGHGTQFPSSSEPDGMQEGLCFWNGKNIEVMPGNDFRALINQIPGTVYIFLDSCFSGGMDRGLSANQWHRKFIPFREDFEIVRPLQDVKRSPRTKNKLYFMAACAEGEVSWSTGSGGLFTRAFCASYDKAQPSARTISKLMKQTSLLCGNDQTPGYECFGGSGTKRIF